MAIQFESHRLRNNLSFQVLLLVVICSVLLTLLVTISQLAFRHRNELATIHRTIQFIEKSYLPSVADSLYRVDEQQLRFQLQGILQLRDIVYVEVVETGGNRKYSMIEGNPESEQDIVRTFSLDVQRSEGKPVELGQLKIVASFGDLHQRIWSDFSIILLSTAAQVFFLALIILLIFRFLITRHLITMAQYTEKVDFAKFETPLVINRKWTSAFPNEIDSVVAAINDLKIRSQDDVSHRRRAEAALQKSYDELEQRVKKRTEELKASRDMTERFLSVSEAMLVELDATGKTILINRRGCDVTGYGEMEIVGESWVDTSALSRQYLHTFNMLNQQGKFILLSVSPCSPFKVTLVGCRLSRE